MTTYTAIPNGDIDPESPVTTSLMTLLRDNPIAITEKASGAPVLANNYVVEAMLATDAVTAAKIAANAVGASEIAANAVGASEIGAGAVHQSEMDKTRQTGSTTSAAGTLITATGGEFCWLPQIYASGTGAPYGSSAFNMNGSTTTNGHHVGAQIGVPYFNSSFGVADPDNWAAWTGTISNTTHATYLLFSAGATNGNTVTLQYRIPYVTASPPFDLGDGAIPLFAEVLVDSSGAIVSTVCSRTPPWAYNGPTDIRNTRKTKDGRKFKTIRVPDAVANITNETALQAAAIAFLRNPVRERVPALLTEVEIEIGDQWKNADMDLVPHQHAGGAPAGHQLIMLDPMDPFLETVAGDDDWQDELHRMLLAGDIILGDAVTRAAPPGVAVHGFRLR